MKNYYIGQTDP